jgi:hypothetical protein
MPPSRDQGIRRERRPRAPISRYARQGIVGSRRKFRGGGGHLGNSPEIVGKHYDKCSVAEIASMI